MFEHAQTSVIPVAGLGTRLLPLTRGIPKELLPLGRLPVLQHVVDEMSEVGVTSQVLVISQRKTGIRQYVEGADESHGNTFQFVDQPHQKGLGHAVLCAREMVANKPFFVALGDAVIKRDAEQESLCERMRRLCVAENADAAIAFHQVPLSRVSRYGVAKPQPGFKAGDTFFLLSDLIEKPPQELAPSRYAIAARYLCTVDLFDELSHTDVGRGGEIQLTDALQGLINQGAKVIGVPLKSTEKRYDIGNFNSYYAAVIDFARQDTELQALLN